MIRYFIFTFILKYWWIILLGLLASAILINLVATAISSAPSQSPQPINDTPTTQVWREPNTSQNKKNKKKRKKGHKTLSSEQVLHAHPDEVLFEIKKALIGSRWHHFYDEWGKSSWSASQYFIHGILLIVMGPVWLLYRKLYIEGIILFVGVGAAYWKLTHISNVSLIVVAKVAVPMVCFVGVLIRGAYVWKLQRHSKWIYKTIHTQSDRLRVARSQGGTNIIVALSAVTTYFWTILGVFKAAFREHLF